MTGRLVPFMVAVYVVAVLYILISNVSAIPDSFALIFQDAFTGEAVLGGALGSLILLGVRRAAFSNEAGIGLLRWHMAQRKPRNPFGKA